VAVIGEPIHIKRVRVDNSSCRGKARLKLVQVPVMDQALNQYMSLGEDIKVILDSGITRRCFARSLGVCYQTTWRWQKRIRDPDPLIVLIIRLWAEEIRNNGH
jgi:hypothetical protein